MNYTSTVNIPNYLDWYIAYCNRYGTGIIRTFEDFMVYLTRRYI